MSRYNLEIFDNGKTYALSKKYTSTLGSVQLLYGTEVAIKETQDFWLIAMNTHIYPPASFNDIDRLQEALKVKLPEDYSDFLKTCKGADLFTYAARGGNISYCKLLSVNGVIRAYHELLERAQYFEGDPELRNLFFIPVAAQPEGNYIGVSTHPETYGHTFEIYNDCGFPPYTPEKRARYKWVYANNFETWLYMVLDSHGALGLDCRIK